MKTVHYVFSTYKRKKILDDWIAEELTSMFDEICRKKGFNMICQKILIDHVHMLICKNSLHCNEYVMKMIKGISSRRFFKRYTCNRYEYRKLWGRGYHAREIKEKKELEKTIAYIKRQKIDGIDKRINPKWKPRRLVSGFHFISEKIGGIHHVS